MKQASKKLSHKRINITLPQDTLQLIDRAAKKGDRSRFIADAVRFYISEQGRKRLRQQLKEGAIARAERDRALAEEWFIGEEESF